MINLKNKKVAIIISIFWGLGLACLFKRACKGRKCITYSAPSLEYMKKNIFKHGNKCYKYTPRIVDCNGKSTISN